MVSELWRHSEQRGFYTKLCGEAAAVLSELGIDPEPTFGAETDFREPQQSFPPPRVLREGFLFKAIELFKSDGNWTHAHAKVELQTHDGLDCDRERVAFGDMLDPAVFYELRSLAARRVIREWHAGPPCFTFGTLRRPRIATCWVLLQPSIDQRAELTCSPYSFSPLHSGPFRRVRQHRTARVFRYVLHACVQSTCFVRLRHFQVLFLCVWFRF